MTLETTTMHTTNKITTSVTTGRQESTLSETMAPTMAIQTGTTGTYSTKVETSKPILTTEPHKLTPISTSKSNDSTAQASSSWKQRTYSSDTTMITQKNLTVTPFDRGALLTGTTHFCFSNLITNETLIKRVSYHDISD